MVSEVGISMNAEIEKYAEFVWRIWAGWDNNYYTMIRNNTTGSDRKPGGAWPCEGCGDTRRAVEITTATLICLAI